MSKENNDSCIRCGEELDSPEGLQTGICADCWITDDADDGPKLQLQHNYDGPRQYAPADAGRMPKPNSNLNQKNQ
jgi:hypothetical protein